MTWIELQGVANARDVGGLPTQDGRMTRHGVLLRSDDPHELTVEDLAVRAELGLTTVIDLRMRAEVDAVGGAALWTDHGVTRVWFDLMPHLAAAPDAAVLARALPQARSIDGLYGEFVARAPAQVAGALRSIAAADGAVLVHCAAGKDRTGVVIALALALVGVGRDAIVADYQRTGERIEAIRERLLASAFYGRDVSGRSLDSMRPRSEHVEQFLVGVQEQYGGMGGLAEAIGLEPATLKRLRGRLLAPPDAGDLPTTPPGKVQKFAPVRRANEL